MTARSMRLPLPGAVPVLSPGWAKGRLRMEPVFRKWAAFTIW